MDQPIPTGRPVRRRFKLTLRAMMALVLLVGGGMGWFVQSVRVQREAVAAIKQAGGHVSYDWDWNWVPPVVRQEQYERHGVHHIPAEDPMLKRQGMLGLPAPWLKWLADYVGHDSLGRVKRVSFPGGPTDNSSNQVLAQVGRLRRLESLYLDGCKAVTDDGLAHLRSLRALRELNLNGSGVEGHGLVHLTGMSRLMELRLDGLSVKDSDLAYLSKLRSLEHIELSGPQITDAGLAHVKDLTNLKWFRFTGKSLSSAGLIHLRGMSRLEILDLMYTRVNSLTPVANLQNLTRLSVRASPLDSVGMAPVVGYSKLKSLDLTGCPVENAGLAPITGLAQLAYLSLGQTRISDDGLVHLANLPILKDIQLTQTAITDAGIRSLSGLKQCRFIHVYSTGVTQAGVSAMKQLNPKIEVSL